MVHVVNLRHVPKTLSVFPLIVFLIALTTNVDLMAVAGMFIPFHFFFFFIFLYLSHLFIICIRMCGECTDGKLCNLDSNQCEVFATCDGLNPVCAGMQNIHIYYL